MRKGITPKIFQLNPAQRQAVETIEGPVMVIAGPGTGKTQTLTARIAQILKTTDTPPDGILALTFTDAAAREMRERLTAAIGPTAYYVNIQTFHAFCSGIIRENPDIFPTVGSMEALSNLERVNLFRSLIDSLPLSDIRPHAAPYLYTQSIISAIADLKRESLGPEEFHKFLKTQSPASLQDKKYYRRNQELYLVYQAYQQELAKIGRYDFVDMITLVDTAFKADSDFLLTHQQRFLYFLADEYQDTNAAQQELLLLLTSYWKDQANIFVVGDDDQAIFRFQGASIENILNFHQSFPAAKLVVLDHSYRSPQNLLDAARAVISHNKLSLVGQIPGVTKNLKSESEIERAEDGIFETIEEEPSKTLLANKPGGDDELSEDSKPSVSKKYRRGSILTGRFSSGPVEMFFVAKKIQELIAAGIPPKDIAVIYRHHQDGAELADMLARLNINFDIEGGKNVLTDPTVQRALLLMRAVYGLRNNQEGIDLFTLLNYPFINCDPLDILKLTRFAADSKINLWETLIKEKLRVAREGVPVERPQSVSVETRTSDGDRARQDPHRSAIELSNPSALDKICSVLVELQKDDAESPFVLFFEKLINKTGLLDWCLRQTDAVDRLNALNSLFSEIKRLNSTDHHLNLESFLNIIELMQTQKVPLYEQDLDIRSDSVTLTTAHRAKGREFSVVFIIKAIDGKWGNNSVRELLKLPEGIITHTDLSRKEKNEDERRLFYVAMTRAKNQLIITSSQTYQTSYGRKETVQSMFTAEIPSELKTNIEIETYEHGVKAILETLLAPVENPRPSTDETAFLKTVISTMKLSPTALNTYLACPYKFKLNNLLRAPRAKDPAMSFGSAIHKALEQFFRQYQKNRLLPDKSILHQSFSAALDREILTPVQQERLIKRGMDALSAYFQQYRQEFVAPLAVEKFFGYGFSKVILGSVPLGGKIDKIEFVNSDLKKVRVIDYKTGRPKSRNDIEGKTALGNGDYKRQLVFYQLLADLDQNFRFTVAETELDFVEADKNTGKLKKERFAITKDEVEELKKIIFKAWSDILALKFPRTTEVKKHCPRCQWLLHCWPDGLPVKNEQLSLLNS